MLAIDLATFCDVVTQQPCISVSIYVPCGLASHYPHMPSLCSTDGIAKIYRKTSYVNGEQFNAVHGRVGSLVIYGESHASGTMPS